MTGIVRCLVSERDLVRFLRQQLGVRSPIGVDKEEGQLTLLGGRGESVLILPADPDSYAEAGVDPDNTPDRFEFPLVHNAFRIVDDDGTDLTVELGLEFTVSGSVSVAVAEALGLPMAAAVVA